MSILLRRLASVTDTIAYLNAQIRELDQVRDLVRKARLIGPKSATEVP